MVQGPFFRFLKESVVACFHLQKPPDLLESVLRSVLHPLQTSFVGVDYFGELGLFLDPALEAVLLNFSLQVEVFLERLLELLLEHLNSLLVVILQLQLRCDSIGFPLLIILLVVIFAQGEDGLILIPLFF